MAARAGGQQRAVIAATSAMLLAAQLAGWQQSELAAFLDPNHQTVQKRIASARRAYAGLRPAIVVDVALDRPPNRLAVLREPAERRQWLTIAEAARHVGRDQYTIGNRAARHPAEHRPPWCWGVPVPAG